MIQFVNFLKIIHWFSELFSPQNVAGVRCFSNILRVCYLKKADFIRYFDPDFRSKQAKRKAGNIPAFPECLCFAYICILFRTPHRSARQIAAAALRIRQRTGTGGVRSHRPEDLPGRAAVFSLFHPLTSGNKFPSFGNSIPIPVNMGLENSSDVFGNPIAI